jgi:hypothetical protein
MPKTKNLKMDFRPVAVQAAEQKWKRMFAELVKFKKENGMLPLRKDDHTLNYWLIGQRKMAKTGRLTEEQLKLYEEAGINILGRSKKDSVN